MKIKYANKKLKKSIFLAGPTPRDVGVPSWRPEAIKLLEENQFTGTVFVPETEDGEWRHDYNAQIHWEWEALNQCTVAVFWVPRELEDMPAFTTNVEFGMFATSSKVILGFPPSAPKMSYVERLADRYNIAVWHSLDDVISEAVYKTTQPFGI